MEILYVKEARDSLEETSKRLETAVKAHQFGVIAVVDLKGKMAEKGVAFANPCRIYEVCNPLPAKQVLEQDMRIATALPCRIALYEEDGHVRLATMLPTRILGLFGIPELAPVAQEVEQTLKAIMDEAAAG